MIKEIHTFLDSIKSSWVKNILNKNIKPKKKIKK